MTQALKRTLIIILYFLFWFMVYSLLYMINEKDVVLLPQFKLSYHFSSIFITFIKYLPSLEITITLILFSTSIASLAKHKLKKHSQTIKALISKLFIACVIVSAINIIISELLRPAFIQNRNMAEQLSKKYYENINLYSVALANKDYEKASLCLKVALSIWDDSQEVLSLQAQLASMEEKQQEMPYMEEKLNQINIPENLSPEEILNIAKDRAKIKDYYTASHYATLILKLIKNDDDETKKEAKILQQLCFTKIGDGLSGDKLLSSQKQFEAKKQAYEALTQKDYEKAYYGFLEVHNDILAKTNKYDIDVEKHLEIARKHFLEEVFFIEEIEGIQNFNSGYNIKFNIDDKHASFNIGNFYYSSTKDGFAIYIYNLSYSKFKSDGSLLSQIKTPYAKIIEKETDGKKKLYLLLRIKSKYSQFKELPYEIASLNPLIMGIPIYLGMTLKDFMLITLAQQEPHVMTILDLNAFIPISKNYGFDPNVYQAELCTRFADFFLFIIFVCFIGIFALTLRAENIHNCFSLFVISAFIFNYLIFLLLEGVRSVFKLFTIILLKIGISPPCLIVIFILFIIFIFTTYRLYNVGYKD